MKYGKRRSYKRRRGSKGLRRMARGRVGKITKLARTVRRLQRRVNTGGEIVNLGQVIDNVVTADYAEFNITGYSAQNLIFGSGADDVEQNSVRHISTGLDILVDANTEDDNIVYTAFLVSLKDEAAPAMNFSTGFLTLTSGVHYQFLDGQVLLNKKYFKIHKYKRLITGNYGTAFGTASAATGPTRNQHRFYWKQIIGTRPRNPVGNWNTLACPRDPSQNYFFLLFNNNSGLDLENPRWSLNIVSTFKTV